MIDTHAHLDKCEGAPETLLAGAREAGVRRVLTVGREPAIALAERFDDVWAIVGWHPHEAGEVDDVGAIRPLLAHPRAVAVGECGLDWYRDRAPRAAQRRTFAAQIELANELDMPLVVHTRDADEDTFAMLEAARGTVVLHCFSSPDRVEEAVARGYLCSFAGNVTYPNAAGLAEAMLRVPERQLLAETDCPYLAPVPRRGRPNVPANVSHTVRFLAERRGVEPDALAAAIETNARRAFGLP